MRRVKHELEAKSSAHHYHELLKRWGSQFLPSALDLEEADGIEEPSSSPSCLMPYKMKEHEVSSLPPSNWYHVKVSADGVRCMELPGQLHGSGVLLNYILNRGTEIPCPTLYLVKWQSWFEVRLARLCCR